jgi:hypothetical protein
LFIYCQHELISPLFPETTVTASKTWGKAWYDWLKESRVSQW